MLGIKRYVNVSSSALWEMDAAWKCPVFLAGKSFCFICEVTETGRPQNVSSFSFAHAKIEVMMQCRWLEMEKSLSGKIEDR